MVELAKKDGMNDSHNKFKQEIHSKVIRAGKRTYFFDVKSTRNDEYYLTITESKKRFESEGKFRYEKHKIFLYKEDFGNFAESLLDVIDYIHEKQPYNSPVEEEVVEEEVQVAIAKKEPKEEESEIVAEEVSGDDFKSIDFEDLNN